MKNRLKRIIDMGQTGIYSIAPSLASKMVKSRNDNFVFRKLVEDIDSALHVEYIAQLGTNGLMHGK